MEHNEDGGLPQPAERPCLCAAGHGCLLDVAPIIPAVEGISSIAEGMLEEAQREARHCSDREDALLLLAKRDALSELIARVKHGRRNARWARLRPTVTVGLSLLLVVL